jgi:hypothetical protein
MIAHPAVARRRSQLARRAQPLLARGFLSGDDTLPNATPGPSNQTKAEDLLAMWTV